MSFTPQTVDFDLIREVGIGGSYLETDDTLMNFREHLWIPKILNRKAREECPDPLSVRAAARARQIVAADNGEKIGADELAELKRIETKYAGLIT